MVSKRPGSQVSPPWSARQGQLLHVRGAKADPAGGARGQQAGAQGEAGDDDLRWWWIRMSKKIIA